MWSDEIAADGDESDVGSTWMDRDILLFTFIRIGMRLGVVVSAVVFSGARLVAGDVRLYCTATHNTIILECAGDDDREIYRASISVQVGKCMW